jgi:hypothetical protein
MIRAARHPRAAPGTAATETVAIDGAEWARSAPLGLMIVTPDNSSSTEAQLISVGH